MVSASKGSKDGNGPAPCDNAAPPETVDGLDLAGRIFSGGARRSYVDPRRNAR
jgi:hypothetical protein